LGSKLGIESTLMDGIAALYGVAMVLCLETIHASRTIGIRHIILMGARLRRIRLVRARLLKIRLTWSSDRATLHILYCVGYLKRRLYRSRVWIIV
jgi:hypothetical protein